MAEDYGCKVCGKHFEEEEDLKNHGEYDHPEVNENYPETFNDEKPKEVPKEAEEFDWDEVPEEEWDDVVLRKVNGDKEEEEPAEEIDQQIDKPIQTHDEWIKELEGLKDEVATEEEKCAICNGEHPTSEHPVISDEGGQGSGPTGSYAPLPEQTGRLDIDPDYNPYSATPERERLQTDPELSRMTEDAPDELIWNSETHHYEKAKEQEEDDGGIEKPQYEFDRSHDKEEGEEEGDSSGADDPLAKVADLAESYRHMKKDNRSTLFESLGFTQGDSAILSGLEWNELTRPIKVEASEAYTKGQEEPEEEEAEENEEDEEDKAYENLYNLEKYHSSPDFKKKSITCNRCNEAFYNNNDRNVHYNDVHAQEQDYKLPETCPYCNIEINEPDNLDWHMQEEHGANVPSQFTQTGIQGAMADTDFDILESHEEDPRVSDLKKERKDLANFINIASIENPLNIGDEQNRLAEIDAELSSLGEVRTSAKEVEHEKCPQCNFETSWKEGDSWQETDAEREMSSHIKDKHGESRATEEGIPYSALEEEEDKLVIDNDEDLYALHKAIMDKPVVEEDTSDYEVDVDEYLKTGEPVQQIPEDKRAEEEDVGAFDDMKYKKSTLDKAEPMEEHPTFGFDYQKGQEQEVETGWLDPDTGELVQERPKKLHTIDSVRRLEGEEEDVELVPDKGKFLNMMGDMQAPPEKAEEDDDEYECEDCGKTFNDPANLQEHQYSNWHGDYKDDYEGQDMPRNVMGGY